MPALTGTLRLLLNDAVRKIGEGLRALGVAEGGILLVHSSLKSLGFVEGGPETVIEGLRDALGPGGTLLMPALSYLTVTEQAPLFDINTTPSCVGAVPEYFRRRPGTLRSAHPTHSVCATGPLAADLLGRHADNDTPCGEGSPFRLLRDRGGQILFLGCGLTPNTSMHAVEELDEPPYLFRPNRVVYEMALSEKERIRRAYRVHDFEGFTQRYDRIEGILDSASLRTGRVRDAFCHLLEARPMWLAAREALRRDPFFFVDAIPAT
ncbi:MAG TPA: AAC(3) family N-acetyltransferase [Capsulimonadaceae bacterium]|nr:AAC(3) family N-acetyltransferase [Capsulimonadaceae bacterium]